jgi:hypothetical protein
MPSKRIKIKRRTETGIPIDDQVFMLPWFLPKQTYLAVRRILPNIHIAKMRYYFEDYGCMRCERRNVLYRTNGLCERCNTIVRWRLTQCLKKRLADVGVVSRLAQEVTTGRALSLAQDLLKPFRRERRGRRVKHQ